MTDKELHAAIAAHKTDAIEAIAMVAGWCGRDKLESMNSGSSALVRICWRMACGMSRDGAAAQEYIYRWHLPLNQWVNHAEAKSRAKPITGAWPVPHLIGM